MPALFLFIPLLFMPVPVPFMPVPLLFMPPEPDPVADNPVAVLPVVPLPLFVCASAGPAITRPSAIIISFFILILSWY
jgi:hypothetical protein